MDKHTVNAKAFEITTTVCKFRVGNIFENVFPRSICSTRLLHLTDQKYSKNSNIVKY